MEQRDVNNEHWRRNHFCCPATASAPNLSIVHRLRRHNERSQFVQRRTNDAHWIHSLQCRTSNVCRLHSLLLFIHYFIWIWLEKNEKKIYYFHWRFTKLQTIITFYGLIFFEWFLIESGDLSAKNRFSSLMRPHSNISNCYSKISIRKWILNC